ncbi:hypothetical protein MSAN_02358800 [Mycena sanguinolenta]|uniref:Uncharacterized protein n=1 Tax=Mycena sanguinolenta TaxID=230812 RepID=A0A8H6X5J0_9AGAR|nr:hypothetical protein MSAN_02358800 [Mycena sanguinolenta]
MRALGHRPRHRNSQSQAGSAFVEGEDEDQVENVSFLASLLSPSTPSERVSLFPRPTSAPLPCWVRSPSHPITAQIPSRHVHNCCGTDPVALIRLLYPASLNKYIPPRQSDVHTYTARDLILSACQRFVSLGRRKGVLVFASRISSESQYLHNPCNRQAFDSYLLVYHLHLLNLDPESVNFSSSVTISDYFRATLTRLFVN